MCFNQQNTREIKVIKKHMQKLNVGIIFGGKSAEHEVSIASAKNIYEALDKEIYEPVLIYIKKDGSWVLDFDLKYLLSNQNETSAEKDIYIALPPESRGSLINTSDGKEERVVDVFFLYYMVHLVKMERFRVC